MAIWLKHNGDTTLLYPKAGLGMPFSIDELQTAVQGSIESLPYKHEGKIVGYLVHNPDGRGTFPRNEDISMHLGLAIYGDALVCSPTELGKEN